ILLCSAAWYENIGALFPPETEPVLLARGVLTGPMNSVVITTVLIPGFVSVLLFLVFTYLHEQSRQPYFRAWQLAWAAYSLHYILDTFPSASASSSRRPRTRRQSFSRSARSTASSCRSSSIT